MKLLSYHSLSYYTKGLFSLFICLSLATFIPQLATASPDNVFVDSSLSEGQQLRQAVTHTEAGTFHLFSHGRSGELYLDGQWRDATGIARWLRDFSLSSAHVRLNIYGCNFGRGQKGLATVAFLEQTLGLTIAASDDLTGPDGDWQLEVGAVPSISALPAFTRYPYNLQGSGCSGGGGGLVSSGLSGDQNFTFNISSSNANSNTTDHILNSLTVAGTTYSDFITPDGYSENFNNSSDPSVALVRRNQKVYDIGDPNWNSRILADAYQTRNLNAYQNLETSNFSNGDSYTLSYSTPVVVNGGVFVAITERNGNNPVDVTARDASNNVIGTINVIESGSNRSYRDIPFNVGLGANDNGAIALFPVEDFGPLGSEISSLTMTFPNSSIDAADSKVFFFGDATAANPICLDNTLTVSDPTVCEGQNAQVQILNSEVGVTYELRRNDNNNVVASPVSGNGGTITFSVSPSTTTTYKVVATNTTTTTVPTTIASDNFSTNNGSGGSGWSGNWSFTGETVVTGGEIFMDGGDPFDNASRTVDLSGYSSATLTIDGRCEDSSSGFESDDIIRVLVSTNGGSSFSTIWSRTGSQICPSTDDVETQNIGPLNLPVGSSNTVIRLRSEASSSSEDYYWDNVVVQTPVATTSTCSCELEDLATVTVTPAPNAGNNGSTTICEGTGSVNLRSIINNEDTGGNWAQASGPSTVSISGDNANFGSANPGSYTFTYTLTAPNCPDDQSTATVTVQAALNAGTNGNLSICEGESFTTTDLFNALGGDPDSGGDWTPAPGGAGTYTYTIPASGDCASVTAEVMVTAETPLSPGTNGTLIIPAGQTVTVAELFNALNGMPDPGGTWSPTPAGAGTYTYTHAATANCPPSTAQVIVTEQAIDTDLGIIKEVNNATPIFGNNVTFTLTVTNFGPTDATNVVVNDPLPGGLTYQSDNGTGDYVPGTGAWTIGNLNVGQSTSLEIVAAADNVGSYLNTAIVSSDTPDFFALNDQSSAEVFPVFPPLVIDLPCNETEFDLTTINVENQPAGTIITYHDGTPPSQGNELSDPTSVGEGVYFLAFFDPNDVCFSGANQVTINTSIQPPAGTDGMTMFCAGETTPQNLFDVITGEGAGGAWSETSSVSSGVTVGTGTSVDFSGVAPGTYEFTYTQPAVGNCPPASSIATVTVKPLPTTPTLATNSPICSGEDAVFTITGDAGDVVTYGGAASGTATLNGSGEATVTVSGVTSDVTLTLTNVNDGTCDEDITVSATVTVNPLPTITVVDGPECAPSLLTYTLTVEVSAGATVTANNGASVTSNGGNSWTVVADDGVDIIVTATAAGTNCVQTLPITAPDCDCPVIDPPMSGGNQVYCVDEPIPTLSATVPAGQTVDWYDAATGGTLLQAGSLSYTPTTPGTYFAEAREISSGCTSATRTPVTLTANPLPTTPTLATNSPICSGEDAVFTISGDAGDVVTYGGAASGTATLNGSGEAAVTVSGVTSDVTLTLTNVDDGTCDEDITVSATVTVNPLPTTPTLATNSPICSGEDAVFTITGDAGDVVTYGGAASGTATLNGSGEATVTVSGVTSDVTLTLTNVNDGTCDEDITVSATVTVNDLPADQTITGHDICAGESGTITVSSSENGVLYQLRLESDDTNIGGPQLGDGGDLTFTVTPASTTMYNIFAINATTNCSRELSQTATVTVSDNPDNALTVSDGTICVGEIALIIVSNTQNGVSYQLRLDDDNSLVGSPVVGNGASRIFTVTPGVSTTYNLLATTVGTDCSVELLDKAEITVTPNPDNTLAVSDDVVCEGESATIIISDSEPGVVYQLRDDTDDSSVGSSVTGDGGDVSITVTVPVTTTFNVFNVLATNVSTNCTSELLDKPTVTVNDLPEDRTVTGDEICAGETATITVENSENGVSYQLRLNSDDTNIGTPAVGDGSDLTFSVSPTTTTGYNVLATTSENCTLELSTTPIITVNELPTISLAVSNPVICVGDDATITVSNTQLGVLYQLRLDSNDNTIGSPVAGNNGTISFSVSPTTTTEYNVFAINVSTNCSAELTDQSTITVNDLPADRTVTGDEICAGETATITVENSENGVSYQLRLDSDDTNIGAPVVGDGNDLTFNVSPTTTTTYNVLATNGDNCELELSTTPTVVVEQLPVLFTVTGGGTYCTDDVTPQGIGLSGSQTGVNYSLFRDGNFVEIVAGTGNPLNFTPQTAVGNYTVNAINVGGEQCERAMAGSATVASTDEPNAGPDNSDTFCAGAGAAYSLTALLSGADGGGQWMQTSGDMINIANPASVNFSGAAPGTYTFTYTVSGTGSCLPDDAVITITIEDCCPDAPVLSLGSVECIDGTTYQYTFSVSEGATVNSLNGTVTGNVVTVDVNSDDVLTAFNDITCDEVSLSVTRPVTCVDVDCEQPDLTLGNAICDGATYSVAFTETTGATITTAPGSYTITGNVISGIPIGTNAVITATNPNDGDCVVSLTATSPTVEECGPECPEELISVSALGECSADGSSYTVNFVLTGDAVLTTEPANTGTVVGNQLTGIPAGTNIRLIATDLDCNKTDDILVMAPDCCPDAPVLSLGSVECIDGTTYQYTFSVSEGATVNSLNGTVTGNVVTVDVNSDDVLTAFNDITCDEVSLSVTRPVTCVDVDCEQPDLTLGNAICDGATYSVAFTETTGATITTAPGSYTITGNVISGIPIGTNAVITATNPNDGDCVVSLTATSPTVEECGPECPEELISVSALGECSADGSSYTVNFVLTGDAVLTTEPANTGTVVGNQLTGIPAGTNIRLIATDLDCNKTDDILVMAPDCCPDAPVLSLGSVECIDGTTYQYTFSVSEGATVNSLNGTVTGNVVTVDVNSDDVLTAFNDITCDEVSLSVTRPVTCVDVDCEQPDLTLGNAICDGATYSVAFTETTGATITTAPGSYTITGNVISGIPIGTNAVITATNPNDGDCVVSLTATSPTVEECGPECPEELISVSALGECSADGSSYTVNFVLTGDAVLTTEPANTGTVVGNQLTGIPAGTNIRLIATDLDCNKTDDILVMAPDCCPDAPVLSLGSVECVDGTTYQYTFSVSEGATVNSLNGTVTGNVVTVDVNSDDVLTAFNDITCDEVSLSVTRPVTCVDVDCEQPDLTLGNAICDGATYSVAFTETTGATITTAPGSYTITGNVISGIPIGTNAVITATNPNDGDCVVSLTATSPTVEECGPECPEELISVSALGECSADGSSYTVNFVLTGDAVLTTEPANTGTVVGNQLTGIPAGTNIRLIATDLDCNKTDDILVMAPDCCPDAPVLSLGSVECVDGTTYQYTFSVSEGATVNSLNGTVTGNVVTVDVNSDDVLTAFNDITCDEVSLSVTRPVTCVDVDCEQPDLTLGNAICDGATYSVAFTETTGATITTAPGSYTITGNVISGIPIGTNAVITATNPNDGDCVVSLTATSPTVEECGPECPEELISVSALGECSADGSSYTVNFVLTGDAVLTTEPANTGTVVGNQLTGIPAGTNIRLIATDLDCNKTDDILVMAPDCCPDAPVLSLGSVECVDGTTYQYTFSVSEGATVNSLNGTVTGNVVTVDVNSDDVLTAFNDITCDEVSLSVTRPVTCVDVDCEQPDLTLGNAICDGATYSVAFTETTGATITTAPGSYTITGNVISGIPIGTNAVITATNPNDGDCVVSLTATSPTVEECGPECPEELISVSALGECSADGSSYTVNFVLTGDAVLTTEPANTGTVVGNQLTGIPAGTNIRLIATDLDCNKTDDILVMAPVCSDFVKLNLKVRLQGALFGSADGKMRDDLRARDLIPSTEPYSGLANYNHVGGGGTEVITDRTTVLAERGDNSIIDWVFVELRSAADPTQVVATRAGLLQKDGDVVETDGISSLCFTQSSAGNYYVAVRHRNHIGTMTANPFPLTAEGTQVDFTDTTLDLWNNQSNYDGVEQVTLGGLRALWAGNTNADDRIVFAGQTNDKDVPFNEVDGAPGNIVRFQTYVYAGYHLGDVNMNGDAIFAGQNNDIDPIFNNVDGFPVNTLKFQTYVILEQLAQ